MAQPSIFAALDFDAALAKARADAKLLLVYASKSSSQMTQVMDRVTWSDAALAEWIAKDAIVIRIDVDAEPALAKKLDVRYPPTIIAFKDGAALDRLGNVRKPHEVIEWLDALARGETSLDRARAMVEADPHDVVARMQLAMRLGQAGLLDDETRECEHLWRHMVEDGPADAGLMKHRTLPLHLGDLFARHPPACDAFARIRDEVAPDPDAQPDVEKLHDWLSLNEMLGQSAKTLLWWDAAHAKLERNPQLAEVLESGVLPLLVDAGRWAEAGTLYRDPRATLKWEAKLMANMRVIVSTEGAVASFQGASPAELAPHLRPSSQQQEKLRRTAAQLVRALRAANRATEADAVKEDALRYDDSPEMRVGLD